MRGIALTGVARHPSDETHALPLSLTLLYLQYTSFSALLVVQRTGVRRDKVVVLVQEAQGAGEIPVPAGEVQPGMVWGDCVLWVGEMLGVDPMLGEHATTESIENVRS